VILIHAVSRSLLRHPTYGIEGADLKSPTNNVNRTSRYNLNINQILKGRTL